MADEPLRSATGAEPPPAASPLEPPRRRAHPVLRRGSLGTAFVAAAAGLLFATSAQIFAGDDSRGALDIEDLARAESARLLELEQENAELREAIQPYLEEEQADPGTEDEAVAFASGELAAEGAGLRVELWDAPLEGQDEDVPPDALVVHQQDLESVMNALWAGGADAMAVQGHRVVSTTGVRCVGNVLHIEGRTYSPPFVVEAIGDPDELRSALLASEGVQIYLQYVEAVRLGWSVTEESELRLPAYSGSLTLQHARVEDV